MPPSNVQIKYMTFDDEFSTFQNSPDGSSGWMTQLPYGGSAAHTLSGNNEQEYYSNSSVGTNPFNLQNGVLSITAQPGSNDLGLPYNSGVITTYKSFSQTYGYFEVNAKLPAGQGLWPAFWLLPASDNYTSELDPMEQLGNNPSQIFSTVHGTTNGSFGMDSQAINTSNTSAGFNTFGVDWEPDTTTFYINGQAVASAPTPTSMNDPMFMLLNLAVGGSGSWPGPPDSTTQFPATMQIDWVHAYATAATTGVGGTDALSSTPPVPSTQNPPPGAVNLGSGPDTIAVSLSEDAWQGDAQAIISVDGTSIGGTQAVTALHGSGQTELFNIAGSWGSGSHSVGIQFINDAYGGTPQTDRNLYVNAVSQNGVASPNGPATLYSNGSVPFLTGSSNGNGSGLVLHMAEDAYQGDAQFNVAVDGQQIGSTQTVTALQSQGATQDFNIMSGLSAGQHDVAVTFLNDDYAGTPSTDRNLYVAGASYNGQSVGGSGMALYSADTQHFTLTVPT